MVILYWVIFTIYTGISTVSRCLICSYGVRLDDWSLLYCPPASPTPLDVRVKCFYTCHCVEEGGCYIQATIPMLSPTGKCWKLAYRQGTQSCRGAQDPLQRSRSRMGRTRTAHLVQRSCIVVATTLPVWICHQRHQQSACWSAAAVRAAAAAAAAAAYDDDGDNDISDIHDCALRQELQKGLGHTVKKGTCLGGTAGNILPPRHVYIGDLL